MKLRTRRAATTDPAADTALRGAVGLDVGSTAIRAVELVTGGPDGPGVRTAAAVAVPEGAVVDGVPVDAEVVTRLIRQLWKGFSSRTAVVGVSHPQVLVRDLVMPALDPVQLARALPFRAADVLPFDPGSAVLDYRVLGPAPGDPRSVSGLLVAVPREPVLAFVRAVEAAGLRVARVDLSAFAVLRATGTAGSRAEAVVDIGARSTTVALHQDGVPRVVRTLSRGGHDLTQRLAERTGGSTAEAEALKRRVGLDGDDDEVAVLLGAAIRPLLADVRGSLHYFATAARGAALDRVVLTGGGAQLSGLADLLAEDVGVPSVVTSPLRHLPGGRPFQGSGHPDEAGASAVAVGLAIGAAA